MRNIKTVEVIRAIVYIMDKSMGEPLLGDLELKLDDETIEFLTRHIMRCSADEETKCTIFDGESNEIKEIALETLENSEAFYDKTREIAKLYYSFMMNNSEEASGDLIVCVFRCEYGICLGIIKLDYNKTYTHNIDYVEEKMAITIQSQMIGIPGPGQKIQKGTIINFENKDCQALVLDREIKKGGENSLLKFLKCSVISDKRDNTKNILNTSEKWIRDTLTNDADTAEKVRRTVTKALKSDDVVNVETIAHYALDKKQELKDEYLNTLKDAGIDKYEIPVDREWAEKKLNRKKLKIDKDIEIYINTMAYEDSERFEIKRNGDGTINILIKHVRNYMEKA
ncbi:MAG: hypothetical protein K0R09_2480 [Clostridiales bacterium]|jgi:hypothetical protein|nr:hypothetical protein [Clostridiales bacterium]